MHVERLDIEGFRNCCESVTFDPALTLLLGENNAGKTNIIDALRLALIAEAGTDRLRPQLSDFARSADSGRLCEEFTITAVLAGLSVKEQGHLSLALAPKTEGYGKARIGLRASIGTDGEVAWHRFGGDFDSPDVEQRALNAVHHTYLPPLRDAGSDLQPGRTNRLAWLLHALTPVQADRDRLVKVAQEANEKLAKDPKVRRAVELVPPDGNHVMAVFANGRGYRWDVRPSSWKRRACAVAGRQLTRAEWEEALPGRDYRPAC
jgi:putative ATP-dependent endonuclease of OLD family